MTKHRSDLINPVEGQDWFRLLLDDCQTIIVEGVHISRWELLKCYHELGNRIMQDHAQFERNAIYGQEIVQRLAKSLGKSERTIYYAIAFYRQFPQIEDLPDGKNASWWKVCTKLLPRKEREGAKDLIEEVIPCEVTRKHKHSCNR